MKETSIKKNYTYQMFYQILSFILPLITSPYIARVIGAEGLGIFSYSYTIAFYFILFAMLGLGNYGNREIARCRNDKNELNKTFSEITVVHFLVSGVVIIVYIAYSLCLKDDQLYAIIQAIYVISAFFTLNWFYFGIENFKFTVTVSVVFKIVNAIAIFLLVNTKSDLWKYCLIMALGALLEQIALWIPLRRYVSFTRIQLKNLRKHIKPLVILFIPVVAASLYKYMDKIMIGAISSKMELGYYENAEKIINMPMAIITSFGTVMLPKTSNIIANKSLSEAKRYISLSNRYVMCLAFALAFGLAGISKVFAPWFWGIDFEASSSIIIGLAITIPFVSFANIIRTQYLIPSQKDKEYLSSVVIGAVVNIVINWILIPYYGANGAMIGTIAAEVTVCLIQTIVVRKELQITTYIKETIPYMFYGFVMFIVVYLIGKLMHGGIETLAVQIIVGVLIYSACTFAYYLKINDDILRNIIVRIKILKK